MTVTIDKIEIPDHMIVEGLEVPEGFGMLSIPDATGDTRIMWNPEDASEVAVAKASFDAAKKNGMIGYRVDNNDPAKKGEVVRTFDATAGKLIMARQLQGG